jgi:hypothetical protein
MTHFDTAVLIFQLSAEQQQKYLLPGHPDLNGIGIHRFAVLLFVWISGGHFPEIPRRFNSSITFSQIVYSGIRRIS